MPVVVRRLSALLAVVLFAVMLISPMSAAAAPTQTKIEKTFLSELGDQNDTLSDAVTDMSDLFSEMADDPSNLLDQGWITDVAIQFATMQNVAIEAKDLKPSVRQQHIYVEWVEVTTMIDAATREYTTGIDNIDAEAITRGTEWIKLATPLMGDIADDIIAFNKNPDVVMSKADKIAGPVADCTSFADFQVAQVYYAGHADEASVIDPDGDGKACEVFFERSLD